MMSLLPAILGSELGFRRWYIKFLVNLFDWATKRIQIHNDEMNENDPKTAPPKIAEKIATSQNSIQNRLEHQIIDKQNSVQSLGRLRRDSTWEKPEHIQLSEDAIYFLNSGIEAIIDDEVTQCFLPEQLSGWNLLARTTSAYQYVSPRLSFIWFLGVVFRWFFLLPWRLAVTFVGMFWMVMSMTFVSWIQDADFRLKAAYWANIVTYRIYTRALGLIVNYHNRENIPQNGSVCVANHTTVIDVVTLSNDRPYALIGQVHGGSLGWFQRRLGKCTKHLWFERSELRDRKAVSRRLMEHTLDDRNYPLLIFPEGTCINNTSVMQFKKGSFEACDSVYPVAIKYNPWFGDAFYNSSRYGMLLYLLRVFTSWAIVAEVYYLPKMKRKTDESSIAFAERCKKLIAQAGGLVDRVWDGQLKRTRVKPEQIELIRNDYSSIVGDRIRHRTLITENKVIKDELADEIRSS